MEKAKRGIWTAIFATEMAFAGDLSPAARCGADLASNKRRSTLGVAKGQRRAIASAALIAALAATGSTAVLADKGGRGRHLGVPSVNLGLSHFRKLDAGAGPFVPSPKLHVAPGLARGSLGNIGVPGASAPGASGLTPSHGATPPGHFATPGLRLGHGHYSGATPTVQESVPAGTGLALGHGSDTGKAKAQGLAQGPTAAMDRMVSTTDGSNEDPSQSRETMPRQLPTCR
jgi:hypothetical protein